MTVQLSLIIAIGQDEGRLQLLYVGTTDYFITAEGK